MGAKPVDAFAGAIRLVMKSGGGVGLKDALGLYEAPVVRDCPERGQLLRRMIVVRGLELATSNPRERQAIQDAAKIMSKADEVVSAARAEQLLRRLGGEKDPRGPIAATDHFAAAFLTEAMRARLPRHEVALRMYGDARMDANGRETFRLMYASLLRSDDRYTDEDRAALKAAEDAAVRETEKDLLKSLTARLGALDAPDRVLMLSKMLDELSKK